MLRRKFIQLSSFTGMMLPFNQLLAQLSFTGNEADEILKTNAIAAFNRYKAVWNFNDFWKRGNTFDACLVFADALYHKWPYDDRVNGIQRDITEMLEENYRYFTSFDPGGLWADDFGWWGLMALNARKHLLRLQQNELADKYLHLSKDLCWKQEKDHAYDFSNKAKPIPHGCSNGDANKQSAGVKNTVTNVLFFLLSARIYRLCLEEKMDNSEQYLEMAYAQWLWFDSWFQLEQFEYLKKLKTGGALVQERPMAFAEVSTYQDTTHPDWQSGWIWSGDQGMVLAALEDMLAIGDSLAHWHKENKKDSNFNKQGFEMKIQTYSNLISKGILSGLVGEDQIIREAPFTSSMGPAFGNDYLAGRGILMRYLGKWNRGNKPVDFAEALKTTADAIWQTRDIRNNQFQPSYTNHEADKKFVEDFRKQYGAGDNIYDWQIASMNEQQKFGVCQSIGLDALGAIINNL